MHEVSIKDLKFRIDIVELIKATGEKLKRQGREYTGLCPFHRDSTPSFKVNAEKQLFYCFGCGAGGDVITYLQLLYEIDFNRALEALREYNENALIIQEERDHSHSKNKNDIESGDDPGDRSYQQKLKILNPVAEIYHNSLLNNKDALHYLTSRGITDLDIINQFNIGYCNGRLLMNLYKEDLEYKTLKDIGIFIEIKDTGYVFEHFKGYLTFPFFDERDNIGEIYGRRIDDSSIYKHRYLKGRHTGIFNLEGIKSREDVYLCEAVLDSLSLVQMGIFNTTCSFGKGVLTDELINALSRHTSKVYLCYDNDGIDDRCVHRTIDLLSGEGIEVVRVILPEDIKDVNEFLTVCLRDGLSLSEIKRKFEGLNKIYFNDKADIQCA